MTWMLVHPQQVSSSYNTGRSGWWTRGLCCYSGNLKTLGKWVLHKVQQGKCQGLCCSKSTLSLPDKYCTWMYVPLMYFSVGNTQMYCRIGWAINAFMFRVVQYASSQNLFFSCNWVFFFYQRGKLLHINSLLLLSCSDASVEQDYRTSMLFLRRGQNRRRRGLQKYLQYLPITETFKEK